MSDQFTPLSWDELLADIPTIAENKAAQQRRQETEQALKSKKPPFTSKKGKQKAEQPAPGKEELKAEQPAPGQEEPKAEPPTPGQEEPKAKQHTPNKEKAKTKQPASGKEKTKKEKPKDARSKTAKGNEKNVVSEPLHDNTDQIDARTKITLPPVDAPTVMEPVIGLPPKAEDPVREALVIDLPEINQASKAPPKRTVEDVQISRRKRRPKGPAVVMEEKRPLSAIIFCTIRRFLLTIFVVAGLLVVGLWLVLNLIFNGPSPTARDVLTMSLSEASGTKWVPGLFLDDQQVEEIRRGDTTLLAEDEVSSDLPPIEINTDTSLTANSDEWKDCPDGIRIERVSGDTYNAYVMLVRDPSKVYLATSSNRFSKSVPGKRITDQIEAEGAIAAINAGAFFDNGTSDPSVGSIPQGLTISQGKVVWDSGKAPEQGFVGFNQDNVLMVADTMTAEEAQALGIRDGCCFGPVLIQNGAIKNEAYNSASGYNPRTAIGQRADGSVILLCIDGRQSQSIGGTYADIIDIMVEYGAVNACNLDGGSSTTMLYRDETGRYGTAGQVHMINNYSLLQSQPRKMPTFIMVRPDGEE